MVYAEDCPAVTDGGIDWVSIEILVACARSERFSDDAGCDPLEYMTACAGQVFERQHRTHLFGVFVFGSKVRLGRWARSGVVLSHKFDYKKEPAKLVDFFWRVAHATAEARGHDPTATRILPGSADYEVLSAWTAKKATLAEDDYVAKRFIKSLSVKGQWWRLKVVDRKLGAKDFLVGQPTFTAPGLVSRGTRGYIALSVSDPGTPLVFLKDCWRVVDGRSEREGDILSDLNQKGVTNIPTILYHGDVAGQVKKFQALCKLMHATQATGTLEDIQSDVAGYPTVQRQHYRLVVREVGLPLQEFRSGQELVSVIIDAVMAHEDAFKRAKVLHRDISVGNILIVPPIGGNGTANGQGLLADWELSKRVEPDVEEPRHSARTGTWQFLSVRALTQPHAQVEIADELESFLHVMLYCAIRYLPHNCENAGGFISNFFDDRVRNNGAESTCGLLKYSVMTQAKLLTLEHQPIVF
ncbi:hypothetical protein FKP32DRAFT_1574173, partial [Trametes sanguinea]